MTQFTATALANHEYLVEGTDIRGITNTTVVDGSQWDDINERRRIADAHDSFDDQVEAFFAPLTKAADEITRSVQVQVDPLLYVVESEASPGTPEQTEVLTMLEHGSVILRAIEQGDTSRLRWVKDDLVVTAQPQAPTTSEQDEVDQG